jgi:phage shock protein A
MFSRIIGYLKQWFRTTAERAMDPEVEVEQAITEAKKRDRELRNQAAKIIAHRTQLESKIELAADTVGGAREMAKAALVRAEEAKTAGQEDWMSKWTQAAQSQALKLQAAESHLNGLKSQYEIAMTQADDAKKMVQSNAMRLQELAAKRMELIGKLQQAKMRESVNEVVESIGANMDMDAPSLERVEEKIEGRLADAKARTELREITPEGAENELRDAISMAAAEAKLDELKAELGLTD